MWISGLLYANTGALGFRPYRLGQYSCESPVALQVGNCVLPILPPPGSVCQAFLGALCKEGRK